MRLPIDSSSPAAGASVANRSMNSGSEATTEVCLEAWSGRHRAEDVGQQVGHAGERTQLGVDGRPLPGQQVLHGLVEPLGRRTGRHRITPREGSSYDNTAAGGSLHPGTRPVRSGSEAGLEVAQRAVEKHASRPWRAIEHLADLA